MSYFQYPPPTKVEFFAGTNDLGKGIFGVSSGFGTSLSMVWSNPPAGAYALTAVASYASLVSTISPPVAINILPPLPPPTNRHPVVGIVANDPIAIEGTNCWPWLGLTNPVPAWSDWFAASPVFR